MNITDIITEFGAYYINQGQNMSRLYRLLRAPAETEMFLSTIITDDTEWRAAKTSINKVLQPFQKSWTPKGAATFIARAIKQFKLKADAEEYPDDLEASWLGFMADNKLDRKVWPFIRWFIEQEFIPQIKEDYELDAIYWGKRKEPTSGTAGETYESMDGLRLGINKAILDDVCTPITLGAWDSDDEVLVSQFEEFADGINKKYWGVPMTIMTSKTLERRFHRGYKKKYGLHTTYKDNDRGEVDFSNLSIKGLHSQEGSDKIWCTAKGNAVRIMKASSNMETARIENVDRLVKMYTDFWKGVGFILGEIIFTNDLDLGEPVISNVAPLAAAQAGGEEITVTGRDFTGVTDVEIDGTPATSFEVVNDRELTFVMPAKSAGSHTVSITNEYGVTESTQEIVVT